MKVPTVIALMKKLRRLATRNTLALEEPWRQQRFGRAPLSRQAKAMMKGERDSGQRQKLRRAPGELAAAQAKAKG